MPQYYKAVPPIMPEIIYKIMEFMLELYSEFRRDKEKNICVSPYSILVALETLHHGARGMTGVEFAHSMKLKNYRREEIDRAFRNWITATTEVDEDFVLRAATALFVNADTNPLLDTYISRNRDQYKTQVVQMNMSQSVKKLTKEVNEFVKSQTEGMIPQMVAEGTFSRDTSVALLSAIYFKGAWAEVFEVGQTREEVFTLADGAQVKVPTMNMNSSGVWYGLHKELHCKVLMLPYKGYKLSMYVILPLKHDGLASWEATNLKTTFLNEIESKVYRLPHGSELPVSLPKFTVDYDTSLNEAMKATDIKYGFTGQADFSGMNGKRDLRLSDTMHKARIEVNETGTEAAASTVVHVTSNSAGGGINSDFRACHPFMFLVRDHRTAATLFMGRVMNPLVT